MLKHGRSIGKKERNDYVIRIGGGKEKTMSDRWIKNISIGVGAIGLNVLFELTDIRVTRLVPCLIGVVVGEVVGTLICKMRPKGSGGARKGD